MTSGRAPYKVRWAEDRHGAEDAGEGTSQVWSTIAGSDRCSRQGGEDEEKHANDEGRVSHIERRKVQAFVDVEVEKVDDMTAVDEAIPEVASGAAQYQAQADLDEERGRVRW